MRILLSILFLLIFLQASSQVDIKITNEDFNKDGVVDTLKTFYDGGSSYGGNYVGIVNGKTSEYYELSDYGGFNQIKLLVAVPPALDRSENLSFLVKIKEELLPKEKREADPSLDWMIKSTFSNIELENNPFFDLIIDPKNKWIEGALILPSNYYLEVKSDVFNKLNEYAYRNEELEEGTNKGYLIYYAHNHYRNIVGDSLTFSDSNLMYKAFNTSHGVLVKKGDLHKWVFISDAPITDAPEKLRWESIHSVDIYNQYLIVQQEISPRETNSVFVINIETGICGRLKSSLFDSVSTRSKSKFVINDGAIVGLDNDDMVTYELREIFGELENQYIH